MPSTIEYGIDLGTCNSTIACLTEGRVELLGGDDGDVLLPSAVHIDAGGRRIVGRNAFLLRRSDPANTAIEFKRLMGTAERFDFPASGAQLSPEELSAEVLKTLARRIAGNGHEPLCAAVITVPAMFNLAQCEATRRAAALAGIENAPLLQEPIAAAVAHAGEGHAGDGNWLVYDLGGGTFDASLVRSRRGRLQVVDHDGDNQLGGKDLDRALTRYVADQLRASGRAGEFRRGDPANETAFARLAAEAERVRVRLSNVEQETFSVENLFPLADGPRVDVSLTISRQQVYELIEPILERTISVCRRILERNRLSPDHMRGIVLVGGPTRMPCLAPLLRSELRLEASSALDPTTVVATGAALFAATRRVPSSARDGEKFDGIVVELGYEAMTTNPQPVVAGHVTRGASAGLSLVVRRADGGFTSPPINPEANGAFAVSLPLAKNRLNVFTLDAAQQGRPVRVTPSSFSILHGLSVARPPLSISVGVMRADNTVSWYFRKGTSLPARATLSFATTIALRTGQSGDAINVPLVQGESERGDRNQLIGVLTVRSEHIDRDLPVGTQVDVTLNVDESSHTSARASIPALGRWFDEVVRMEPKSADAGQLAADLNESRGRIEHLESLAAQLEASGAPQEADLDGRSKEIATLLEEGDRDSRELADQMLRELKRDLDTADGSIRTQDLKTRMTSLMEFAQALLQLEHLKPEEFREIEELHGEFEAALNREDVSSAEAKFEAVRDVTHRGWMRTFEFWEGLFQNLCGEHEKLGTLGVAQGQLQEGMEAIKAKDRQRLSRACLEMIDLLPKTQRNEMRSHVL